MFGADADADAGSRSQ